MKTTLICTVGGSHQPIVRAIESARSDHVCFICSSDDPATGNKGSYIQITGKGNIIKASFDDKNPNLPNIPTQTGLSDNMFEILKISADDFDDIYRKINQWMRQQDKRNCQIVADYTGGTKTMSAALVAAALDNETVELKLVTDSRANLVRVQGGGGMAVPASVETVRFQRKLREAMMAWQHFAYDESVVQLEAMPATSNPDLRSQYQLAHDLSRAFAAWDRFDHTTAHSIIERYKPRLGANETLRKFLIAIKYLYTPAPAQQPMKILDLWHNANRRSAQGRYDDGVARLYRLLEWTAQWLLQQTANIQTANIPPEKIPDDMVLGKNREGNYQAGLYQAWQLASHYGDSQLKQFWQREQTHMLNLLQTRNHSILAHGEQAITERQWQDMATWVGDRLIPELHSRIKISPFNIQHIPPQLPVVYPFSDNASA